MKKNLIIGVLSIISILSVTFAIYQRTIARRMQVLVLENVSRMEQMRIEAEQQRALAIANANEAARQAQIAAEQAKLAAENARIAARESKKNK